MELLRKRKISGFTIIELIMTLIITTIVVLTIMLQFSSEYNFRRTMQNKAAALKEARNAMYNMTTKLRYADVNSITLMNNFVGFNRVIRATIVGGHLKGNSLHDDEGEDVVIYFGWTDHDIGGFNVTANTVSMSYDPNNTWYVIGNYITDFSLQQDVSDNRELTIGMIAKENSNEVPIQTKIRVLEKL